jgi:hypothetical protein
LSRNLKYSHLKQKNEKKKRKKHLQYLKWILLLFCLHSFPEENGQRKKKRETKGVAIKKEGGGN